MRLLLSRTSRSAVPACLASSPSRPPPHHPLYSLACRRRYWPSKTSMSGAAPTSTSPTDPPPPPTSTFHLLLTRHAESFNNVLAERLQQLHGESPYHPDAGAELVKAYDAERKVDPDLSVLGLKQANLLPVHPHLFDVRWVDLVKAGRLRVLTSPMLRTIQTSFPLLRCINRVLACPPATPTPQLMQTFSASADEAMTLMSTPQLLASVDPLTLPSPLPYRARIHPDFCERGGLYEPIRTPSGAFINRRTLGLTRAQLSAAYGTSHTAEMCGEEGWWNLDREAEEEDDEYFARVDRAIAYVLHQARAYAATLTPSASPSPSPSSPTPPSSDYLVVVSHADFIDSFLTRILRLGNGGRPRHVFYATNTSVSHVEVRWVGDGSGGGGGGVGELGVGGGKGVVDLSQYEIRIRCANSRPRRIKASTPPADEPEVSQNGH